MGASAKSLVDHVYEHLLEQIITGAIRYGDTISIKGVASRLSVSSMPVREALKRLEFEGVVDIKPRSSCTVRVPSRRTILEVYALREALEVYALSCCGAGVSRESLARMERIVAGMRGLGNEKDPRKREKGNCPGPGVSQRNLRPRGQRASELLLPAAQPAGQHDSDAREDLPHTWKKTGRRCTRTSCPACRRIRHAPSASCAAILPARRRSGGKTAGRRLRVAACLDHAPQESEQEDRQHDCRHHAVEPVALQQEGDDRHSHPEDGDGNQDEEAELDHRVGAQARCGSQNRPDVLQESRLPRNDP